MLRFHGFAGSRFGRRRLSSQTNPRWSRDSTRLKKRRSRALPLSGGTATRSSSLLDALRRRARSERTGVGYENSVQRQKSAHLQGMTEFSHLRAGRTRRASAQRVSRSVSVFSRSTAEPGVRRDETPQCPPCSSVARRGLGFKVSSSAPCRAGCKKRRRRLEKVLWGCANSVLRANE